MQATTTLRIMGPQHKELRRRPGDSERLRLYAQAIASEHHALEESLGKAQSWSRHWEQKAKEGFEKTVGAEKKEIRLRRKVRLPG